jgi:DNA-binding response OmpR family regulator
MPGVGLEGRSMNGGVHRTAAVETAQHDNPHMADLQHFGNVVEAGDFRLDLSRRVASLRGRELSLSAAEFDVLLFLTNHPTNVLTSSTTLITNCEGREVRKAEFLQILLSLCRKIASTCGTNTYLNTESVVFCRFSPSGSRRT